MKLVTKILPLTIGLALLTALLAVASRNMVVDLDLFHEMALFREFQERGHMPLQDSFAYTPTIEPVVHHEWGTGAILYWIMIASGWGEAGVVALKYVLSFGVGVGCFLLARYRGASLATFALLAPIALNIGGWIAFTNVRAQLFTLLFMVALLFILEFERQRKRWWIWCWCPLVVIWANLHGGVVSGIGILGIYAVSQLVESFSVSRSVKSAVQQTWHLFFIGALTFGLLLINPYGWDYIPYLIRAVQLPRPLIGEWAPIWQASTLAGQVTFLISLLVAGYAILTHQRKLTFELLALSVSAYLAIRHVRHGSLYAVIWISLVPSLLNPTTIGQTIEQLYRQHAPRLVAIGLVLSILATGFAIDSKFWQLRIPAFPTDRLAGAPYYPLGPVNYLRQTGFSGNLFVPFSNGAYVSWNLYPAVKVSIDSRYEVAYPPGAVEENVAFYRAQDDWQSVLDKYDTDAILVPKTEPILKELQRAARQADADFLWQPVFQDKGYVLFMRPTSTTLATASQEQTQTKTR